ncbi:unnamed protein product [Bursaphelenchus okinawaensis]|uniref:RING-type domain-containing protein n=1 Tax=Bursaphelenchus okinawaensis TaxID=465554 RepID=A0A811LIZ3_9BILA|nr:unnamed protein product [Bursaphelenchus okinawaensis]CAG9124524.1 unnamed protein product [Bursaphelenchus okinawaensis]
MSSTNNPTPSISAPATNNERNPKPFHWPFENREYDFSRLKDGYDVLYKKLVDYTEKIIENGQSLTLQKKWDMYRLSEIVCFANRNAADMIVLTYHTIVFKNSTCHVCLEEESVDPMYCLQCCKVIGCRKCLEEWLEEEQKKTFTVKCLNCQRRSFSEFPMFYPAKL